MKKTIIWLIIGLITVLGVVGVTVIFDSEAEAIAYRDSFTDYPQIIGQANITRISGLLDNDFVIFEWELIINNKRDNTLEILNGGFEVNKANKDNSIFVENLLNQEVQREFDDLNKTFVPNPLVEYKSNSLWGKLVTITKGGK